MEKTMRLTELTKEAIHFRQVIDKVKYNFSARDRMREFPKGCCDDAADLFAHYLYSEFQIETIRVDGSYYDDNPENNDWHTWLEVDGYVVDLIADFYCEYYDDIYVGKYDAFHNRYEQKRQQYRGFIDLCEDCYERMQSLYDAIESQMKKG